jgi:hypothetical protein
MLFQSGYTHETCASHRDAALSLWRYRALMSNAYASRPNINRINLFNRGVARGRLVICRFAETGYASAP